MLRIQGTGRSKLMAGRKRDGNIEQVPDVIFARKHLINDKGWRTIKKYKHLFCFVSSPKIYTQDKLRNRSKGWCHALRDKRWLPDAPEMLLPESDFLDADMVFYRKNTIEYDYFYFTLNSGAGIEHKGLHIFLDVLPILCERGLRGKVVVYYPNSGNIKKLMIKMSATQRKNLRKYSSYLDFHWGLLSDKQINDVMTSCRFGFFPNVVDNSPRMLSECLIRNVPAVVNKNIHGGWHYINNKTGILFSPKTLDKSIEYVMNSSFRPRDYFMEHYGFKRSSSKLASFVNGIIETDYTHMYFRDFKKYLGKI